MREKLIELVSNVLVKYDRGCLPFVMDELADHLIANGVTIQRWIPVTERLPDLELVEANANAHNWYACLVAWRFSKDKISVKKAWYDGECFDDGFSGDITDDVTHWMPLPEAPKEEANPDGDCK